MIGAPLNVEIVCSYGSHTFQSLNFPYLTKRIPFGSCGLAQMAERLGQFLFCLHRRCFDSFELRKRRQASLIYSNGAYCCAGQWWYHKGRKQFYPRWRMCTLGMLYSCLLVLDCNIPLRTTRNVRFPHLGFYQLHTFVVHLTELERISHLEQECIHKHRRAQFQWTKVA